MRQPILIGIHGIKRAGKDTTARFVKELVAESDPALVVYKRGFADYAKWSFARQFFPKIPMDKAIEWVDKFKDSDAAITYPTDEYCATGSISRTIPFRECMAQAATEGARLLYGDDHWVRLLLPDQDERHVEGWCESFMIPPKTDRDWPYSIADYCLITDVRFDNEVDRIHELGGKCWKVKRRDAEQAAIDKAKEQGRPIHASELGLPDDMFDYIIDNDDNDMEKAKMRTAQALRVTERQLA